MFDHCVGETVCSTTWHVTAILTNAISTLQFVKTTILYLQLWILSLNMQSTENHSAAYGDTQFLHHTQNRQSD